MPFSVADLRFAVRSVLRTPGQSLLAVLALALGIGLTSTVFSVVYGAAIKGLPFEESERLHVIDLRARSGPADGRGFVSNRVHQLDDWQARQRSFEELGAWSTLGVNLGSEGSVPERLPGALLTANVLRVLRVRPEIGREFDDADGRAGAPLVVIIGHGVWQSRFGGDPDIVGRAVRVNGRPATIVGVMPEGFGFPLRESIWLPLDTEPLQAPRGQGPRLTIFGRLTDDASIESAQSEFRSLVAGLVLDFPDDYAHVSPEIRPYWRRFLGDDAAAPGLYTMLLAVFGVLLVACANVANLLLARAVMRTKELAVRVALGASRAQVAFQVLAESAVIAVAGGVAGLGFAWIGIGAFRRVAVDTNPPFWMAFTLNGPVVAFVIGLVVVSALVAGLVPALRSARPNLIDILADAPRGGTSLRMGRISRLLVTVELALSIALLLPSASFVKSIVALETREFGFAVEDVLTGWVSLPDADYPDEESRLVFFRELQRRLDAGSGVRSAALTSLLPAETGRALPFEIEGQPAVNERERASTQTAAITEDFFDTYGVAPVEGRGFTDGDMATSEPVIMVNQRFAERFFPDGRAVGRRIRIIAPGYDDEPWRRIVGIAPDMFFGAGDPTRDWGVYLPLEQRAPAGMSIVIRANGAPGALADWMRRTVASIDPGLPVGSAFVMKDVIFQETWQTRLFGTLFASFGGIALFLAVVGLYGVVAFSTRQRTREIGVRVALGAEPAGVVALIVRQGFWQLLVGSVFGIAGGLALTRALVPIDIGVRVFDPVPHGTVLLLLTAAAVVAHLVPAVRASRTNPAAVLRG